MHGQQNIKTNRFVSYNSTLSQLYPREYDRSYMLNGKCISSYFHVYENPSVR